MLNKEDSENWSESDTEVKKGVKKKSNSSSIKPTASRKGHAKISSRRKKGKKDPSHRKKNTSVSSSGTGASSSTSSSSTSSSSSSSSDSSGSSDSNDRRKVKKKKSRTSLSKSKKKSKKRVSKAKELARKQRLKKKRKEKKKLKEQQAAKLKGKKKREEKRKDDPYSSEDQEFKTEVLAKKVKKASNKTSTKKLATKRKGREPDRDKKKKRRKREESSSSSSSSDSETMRKAKNKKKTKKRSSNAGSIDTSQHSSKKRRKTTDDNEIDPVLTDQFSMQTVLNIKREKTSEDEMIKVTEEFSPRINRTVHNQEIISVNELHSDFVESSKKNVIIPDAVVKIEPPAIELIQEMQETSLPKDESERFSVESEHSNSTTSFASLRNSLSFEHNSNDSNNSAQSSDNNSLLNSESPCDNSTSSLRNDVEISRDVEMAEENPVKKAAGHFESVAKSMHGDSNSMIESALGRGKDSSNIEHVKDIPKVVHSQLVLSADTAKDVSDIIVTSRPKEFASTEPSQEAVVNSVESVKISQVPVTVVTEKPKGAGIGLVTLQDIESNRRAVEEFDRLKREFEEFTRERLNVSNMSAERLAAAEELKRQFDMVENYDLPVVTKPVTVETKPVTDIRPIPTVTGIVPQDSSGRLASKPVHGEIKWDWRPDSSHGSTANRTRRPSRWGVTPQPEMQNSVLIEVELKSDSELRLPNTHRLSEIPTPCTPDDEPSDDKVYKIQTISSVGHEVGGDTYHMDGMAAEYEESYDMYSEERAMGGVFGLEEVSAEDEEAKAKKISLDDRINMVLQYPGLSVVGEVTNGAASPSPPHCVIKPSPDKGILVVAGVKITRLDPRTPTAKLKRVCFSDGLAPGQDSDDESVTPTKVYHPPPTKSRMDSKKKKRSKPPQCGGHAYPCPPSWPSYAPRWDPLPPPPPPPGSPPPQLFQPRCSITSTIMNAPDAFITRLPKIPSHTETIG